MSVITFRQAAIATAMMAAVGAAQALTLNTSALNANSTQAFSEDAVGAFEAYATTVEAAGTTTDAGNHKFVLPITKVVIGSSLKPTSGDVSGAALKFSRTNPTTGVTRSVYLANFRIDYTAGKVLADRAMIDATGAAVTENIEIYTYETQQALALKYKFPLGISLNEVLGPLTLSSAAIESFITGLKLPTPNVVRFTLPGLDFGTLQQIIEVSFRKKAVSNKPFVAPL